MKEVLFAIVIMFAMLLEYWLIRSRSKIGNIYFGMITISILVPLSAWIYNDFIR